MLAPMARTYFLFALVAISVSGSVTGSAHAQTPTAFVAIRDLTVEGRDAPSDLRSALDDQTTGVMHAFDVCYAAAQGRRGDAAGEYGLRLWVSAQQVIRVTQESATITDTELYECVKQRLLEFHLPPDSPRAGVTVRFRLVFTAPAAGTAVTCSASSCSAVACGAMGAPCCAVSTCSAGVCLDGTCQTPPPPPAPPITVAVTRSRGGRTMEELAAAIPSATFGACVDSNTTFHGDVPFTVTVTTRGAVRATASRGTLRDRAAITCLRSALTHLALDRRARTTYGRIVVTVGTR